MNYMKGLCESIGAGLLPLFLLFHSLLLHGTIKVSDTEWRRPLSNESLRQNLQRNWEQYMKNPPEGMTSDEVRDMSDDDLLDMDYFTRI